LTAAEEAAFGVLMVLIPNGAAFWWASRRLPTIYPRREAHAVSVAFGVFTLVSMLVDGAVSPMFGFFEPLLLSLLLVGVFMGTATLTALLSFLVCVLVLRNTRLTISVEEVDRP
jgi:hypothetical protein